MSEPFKLNLVDMLTGDVNRLRYIFRFGTALTLHKESVAEHTFYVSIYAYLITRWVKANTNVVVDLGFVLEKSILHDLEESRTGDFPRPFKYRRKELKVLLDEAAKDEFRQIVQNLLPDCDEVVEDMTNTWEHARDEGEFEGCIVAIADYLSVISHLWQEVNSANHSMYQHYESVMEYLHTFKELQYEFMRPIVDQVEKITIAVFDRSQETLFQIEA